MKAKQLEQLLSFIRKEFYHVFRDRKTLLMLFGLPIVQIILFGFALTNEVKHAHIAIVDDAKDETSMGITRRIDASKYFDIDRALNNKEQLEAAFREGKIKAALIFPPRAADALFHQHDMTVQIITDASELNTATTIDNYLTSIIGDYQQDMMATSSIPYRVVPRIRMLYNPQLKGEHTFIPGMMAMIMLLICVMMTAISIVREKELGTMEILLVSPFKPMMVIVSKFIPYLLISLFNVTSILLLSRFLLGLPVQGSIVLLYTESLLFVITGLSLGLLISIISKTQQTAMFASVMATMLPTMLLSGFIFPIENMPLPLQILSNIVPSKWFYIIVKSIMIKGLGFEHIWKETLILVGMTLVLMLVCRKNFKIRLE
ncbi:MAG: ABC transporter permease [Flavobacteriales bacterium]|nr:ABC transporter permease [Flavobacteriales bacterium]MCB9447994.1 ABC transporter permease [Flavobacteriales bacterium]